MDNVYGLAWRIAFIFCVPLVTIAQKANAGLYVDAIKPFTDELIILACIVCLTLGTLLGVYFPDDDGMKPLPKPIKALASAFMGVVAFLYILHVDQRLSIINALWVGGVAFVAPAIIGLSRQWIISTIKAKAGIGGSDTQ